MAFTATLSRPARLAGLSAAALLALTACAGQDADDSAASSAAPAASSSSEQAQGSESAQGSASSSELSAAPVDFETGTCLTAPLGARDLSSFEAVDCAGPHTAEYLWAVPAAAEGAAADPAANTACTAQGQRLNEEKAEELQGVVLTSAELDNYGTDEKHCVAYAITGEWEGQIVDPELTLDEAIAASAGA
ncbi:hypothetical protein [Micrococcus endophyticus]|uniref:hypothetical protein n=1 Tax=Micrococcus endophyticus TaxID=455343 RepID=UPI0020047E20|nr:hypothetical protein [Micrococcus endophyticus]MCK6091204.1 hypothetical protein [Micrococcus endophyticus]